MSNNRGGQRNGSGRKKLNPFSKKTGYTIYFDNETRNKIMRFGKGTSFSKKVFNLIELQLESQTKE